MDFPNELERVTLFWGGDGIDSLRQKWNAHRASLLIMFRNQTSVGRRPFAFWYFDTPRELREDPTDETLKLARLRFLGLDEVVSIMRTLEGFRRQGYILSNTQSELWDVLTAQKRESHATKTLQTPENKNKTV